MARIALTGKKFVVVDDEYLTVLTEVLWYPIPGKHTWYVATKVNGKTTYMHRILMNAKEGETVDHINGDGLDNRIVNLRIATYSENARNGRSRVKRAEKSSKYKGVSYRPIKKMTKKFGLKEYSIWRAEIELPGRKRKIKYAKTELEAARLYNEMAKEHFGEFARLNQIGV